MRSTCARSRWSRTRSWPCEGRVTLFVVRHRLSMLAVCDRVIVLSNGRIEALEPTAHLRRRSAFYQGAVALTARTVS